MHAKLSNCKAANFCFINCYHLWLLHFRNRLLKPKYVVRRELRQSIKRSASQFKTTTIGTYSVACRTIIFFLALLISIMSTSRVQTNRWITFVTLTTILSLIYGHQLHRECETILSGCDECIRTAGCAWCSNPVIYSRHNS